MTSILNLHRIHEQGYNALALGTRFGQAGAPFGFTFCPYPNGSQERIAFLAGCATLNTRFMPNG